MEYIIYPTDNTKIFTRNVDFDEYDSSVYIWTNKSIKCNINLKWDIHIEYSPIYIGHGKAFGDVPNWRAFTHNNDKLNKLIKADQTKYLCYIIGLGINKQESQSFESYLIKILIENYHYFLSRKGEYSTYLKRNQLVNKRRERTQEELFTKFLNLC